MLVLLPEAWPEDLESRVSGRPLRVVRRGADGKGRSVVRSALRRGERLFLLCADGAAADSGWMAAEDHIDLFGSSPLAGPNLDDLGPRFPSLKGIYRSPEGSWSRGVVLRVPRWELATPAELSSTGAAAAVSSAVEEAIVAGHGGGSVMLLVRCSAWGSVCDEPVPLSEAVEALLSDVSGDERDGAQTPKARGR